MKRRYYTVKCVYATRMTYEKRKMPHRVYAVSEKQAIKVVEWLYETPGTVMHFLSGKLLEIVSVRHEVERHKKLSPKQLRNSAMALRRQRIKDKKHIFKCHHNSKIFH